MLLSIDIRNNQYSILRSFDAHDNPHPYRKNNLPAFENRYLTIYGNHFATVGSKSRLHFSGNQKGTDFFLKDLGTEHRYNYNFPTNPINNSPDISCDEIILLLFRQLHSEFLGQDYSKIIISVPVQLTSNQCNILKDIVIKSGFIDVQIISSPIATGINYYFGSNDKIRSNTQMFDVDLPNNFLVANKKIKTGKLLVIDCDVLAYSISIVDFNVQTLSLTDSVSNFSLSRDIYRIITDNILSPYLNTRYSINQKWINESAKIHDLINLILKRLCFSEEFDYLSDLGEFGYDANGEDIEIEMIFTREQVFSLLDEVSEKLIKIFDDFILKCQLDVECLNDIIIKGEMLYFKKFSDHLSVTLNTFIRHDIRNFSACQGLELQSELELKIR